MDGGREFADSDAMTPTSSREFLWLANGASVPWAEVPEWPADEFPAAASAELERGGRLCAWFGVPEGAATRLVAIIAFDTDNTLVVGRSAPLTGAYPALTPRHPQAHLFEREVWEQHGLKPEGHPWLKPVRREAGAFPVNGNFFQIKGGEIHEVAVGPVHAGIIEPGHFRFQCNGEDVLHLEIALGYQHRGIEEALSNGPHRATLFQMETIAGDTSIGHATAHAMVLEALANTEAPLRAQWLRAIALELERLANHTGDIGALASDVAFLPTSSACGKIRGDFLNLTALICGNRFGRGLVRPGGCRFDLEPGRASQLLERLRKALADVEEAAEWFRNANDVRHRFEMVGTVTLEQATDIGLVGMAARASGVLRDVRFDHPAGWHRFAQIPVAVWPGGDVLARAQVRWLEIQRSGKFLEEQLVAPPEGGIRDPLPAPAPDTLAVALVEGWRGEVCHAALTNAQGQFRRYKIVDPSFHNWTGLALALRGQAISDFPICNKSFNLSYCGFDL
jgi:Ni,Fe-hydrogenase III large subunit